MFVHDGLDHVFVNMLILWIVGRMAERIFGRWLYLAIYVVTGTAGALLSLGLRPERITCGASAAILGIVTALIAALFFGPLPEAEVKLKKRLWILTLFTSYSLYSGWHNPHIDAVSHWGAVVAGLMLGLILIRSVLANDKAGARFQQLTFSVAGLILISAMILIRHLNGYVVSLELADQALNAGKLDEALNKVMIVLAVKPNDILAKIELGNICLKKGDYVCAESSLKSVLASDPENNHAQYSLGLVYLHTGRFDEALAAAETLFRRKALGYDEQALFAAALDGKGEHRLAGDHFLTLKRYDGAISSFQSALRQNPGDEHSRRGLAEAYRAKGMNDEANSIEGSSSSFDRSTRQPQPTATPHI